MDVVKCTHTLGGFREVVGQTQDSLYELSGDLPHGAVWAARAASVATSQVQ